jgi:hypothetical protein
MATRMIAGSPVVRRQLGVWLATFFAVSLAMLSIASRALADNGFGIASFSTSVSTTQAGAHPDASLSFALDTYTLGGRTWPVGNARDIDVDLPPGFVGNPQAVPQCPEQDADVFGPGGPACPPDTQVGVIVGQYGPPQAPDNSAVIGPVYNVKPAAGHPAEFIAYVAAGQPVFLLASVRSDGDYGVTVSTSQIAETVAPESVTFTFWGVPADPSHDPQRGLVCLGGAAGCSGGNEAAGVAPAPFLTNPTNCDSGPVTTTLRMDSWENPGQWASATSQQPQPTGCDQLRFDPSISVTPDTTRTGSPAGLSVDLHVPQTDDPNGLATPELRDATVTLPVGMALSPSAANGLDGCTPSEIGIGTDNPMSCPDAAKIGTVEIDSSLLPGPLTGSAYLGKPQSGSITGPPYTMYLYASGFGVQVRLVGSVSADPVTGQLTTTFTNNPQLPFDDLKLDFFGGPGAVLSTPLACATNTATSSLTPFSGGSPATPSSSFTTSFDGAGAPCPSSLPFAPSFSAGTTSTRAGAFTSFVMNLSRSDGQQLLSGVSVSLPPGLLGVIASVPLCQEPAASEGTCPADSQLGTATTGAGPGPDPVSLSGPVYLTGPYRGAPFGLTIVVPAAVGPFSLGNVVVRAAIAVNPDNAQITAISDTLPQMVDTAQGDSGIPVDLQNLTVDIDRPGFLLNPTSCSPMVVDGTLTSNQGATAAVSSPFQVANCASLPFNPTFQVSTQAKTSKANGASLDVKVAQKPGEANIHKVDVTLPLALPSRLTTLQKACAQAQFESNPARCPEGSFVGVATARTPVLAGPLTGRALLVSHGGAAFPDLVIVLQGEGIRIDLVGNTDIKKGLTFSRFETVPDAAISSFELELPEGPHSALAAYGSLCSQTLVMPTTIVGQNGAQVTQSTNVVVTGCGKPSIKITKAKIKGNTVLVTVTTTQQGTVTVSGNGLKTTRKTLGAGAHQLDVSLTKNGRTARADHRKTKVKASVTNSNGSSSNTITLKL